jgi:hypothetical protein
MLAVMGGGNRDLGGGGLPRGIKKSLNRKTFTKGKVKNKLKRFKCFGPSYRFVVYFFNINVFFCHILYQTILKFQSSKNLFRNFENPQNVFPF